MKEQQNGKEVLQRFMDIVGYPTLQTVRKAFDSSSDLLEASEKLFMISGRTVKIEGIEASVVKEVLQNGLPSLILANHTSGMTFFAIGAALRQEFNEHRRVALLSTGMNRGLHPLLDREANFVDPLIIDRSLNTILHRPYVIFQRLQDPEQTKKENHESLLQFTSKLAKTKLGVLFPDGHKVGKPGIGLGIILHSLYNNFHTDINIIKVQVHGFTSSQTAISDWAGMVGLNLQKTIKVEFVKVTPFSSIAGCYNPSIQIDQERHQYTQEEKGYFKKVAERVATFQ